METIIDYIGTTIGIHSPIPYYQTDSVQAVTLRKNPTSGKRGPELGGSR